MSKRMVDKTKKSNIKCEHCENWTGYINNEAHCRLDGKERDYYQRCKRFQWKDSICYKFELGEVND